MNRESRTPAPDATLPQAATPRTGRGLVTGCDLSAIACLRQPFQQDPFYRLRPPLRQDAMTLSLELAAMAYHLELEDWLSAGWTDVSIQIDNTLQSGVTRGESTSGEQMRNLINYWKLYRAKSSLRERNPIAQVLGALRQREKSDTIKAVTLLRKTGDGRYIVAVGFMGTGSRFYDWFSNFRFSTEDGFHKGFSQLTGYFEQSAEHILFPDTAAELGLERLTLADVLAEMKSADSRFFLWMAGHSQGAAVMQVFCHKLLTDWLVLPQNVMGYGFASPTVATGRLLYDPARYPLYHVLNSDDVVTRMGALLHLGLCLQYQATEPFRTVAYAWSQAEADVAVRQALYPFALQMTDMATVMETCVALCYCVLEEKGEDALNSLIDRKWALPPIEKALTFAGGKAQDVVRSIARYTEEGYTSLTGHGMDEGHLSLLKQSLRPVVERFTLRQLLGGLHALSVPPHMIMREHFKLIGAYNYIVLRGWAMLTPFIWVNQEKAPPERRFAQAISWEIGPAPSEAALPKPSRIRRPSAAKSPKGPRGKGVSALKQKRKITQKTGREIIR